MKLKVQVEDLTFDISVGEEALNDFAWLALTAAKLYGKQKYPAGNYLPVILRVYDTVPHPRTKLIHFIDDVGRKYFEPQDDKEAEDSESAYIFTVELQKQNMVLNEQQKDWFDKAFGSQRNLMHVYFEFTQYKTDNKKRETPFICQIQFNYQMFKELKNEFKGRNYENKYTLTMKEEQDEGAITYSASITLPYGDITPEYPEVYKINKHDEDQKPQLINLGKDDITFKIEPKPISQEETLKKIKNHMTIPPQLSEKLLQQEQDIKKEVNTGSFCPFDFMTLWQIIENNSKSKALFEEIDLDIRQKMQQTIQDNLNKLYEIFFEYSMLYVQNTDKKEEIAISLQDIMHFLKFYLMVSDSQNLFQFLEVYEQDNIRIENARSTIDNTNATGIMFPEFIEIIMRSVNFMQTEILMSNEESLDQSLEKAINQVITIDSSENDLNEFHKHMKYNITLMTFIRENSDVLQAVFLEKLQDSSLETKKYHLLPQQIKSLIIDAGFKGDNLDDIVTTSLTQLIGDEKYHGFEGIFYYEFLQVMQWLSLVLITDQDEEEDQLKDDDEDPEQGVEQLIEKFRFFIQQFQ